MVVFIVLLFRQLEGQVVLTRVDYHEVRTLFKSSIFFWGRWLILGFSSSRAESSKDVLVTRAYQDESKVHFI